MLERLILGSITPQHVSLLEVVLEVQKHMFGEGRYVGAAKSLHQELSDEFLEMNLSRVMASCYTSNTSKESRQT